MFLYCAENKISAQVYDYSAINYWDIETNPSIVAFERKNNTLNLNYQNSIVTKNNLSSSTIQFSKYFSSNFWGLGLTLNNTSITKSNYKYVGLSVAYRTVVLNEVLLRIGTSYKVIQSNKGTFDYFVSPDSVSNKGITSNANISVSLSTAGGRHFISYSVANINLPWDINNAQQFPSYSILHIGNLMSFFDARDAEISYTGFQKKSATNSTFSYNHYVDFKFVFHISRKASVRYGARLGYAENKYVHAIPFLTCYNRKTALTLFYNTYVAQTLPYPSSIQLNLTYKL